MQYYRKALKEYCYTEYHLQTQDVNLKEKRPFESTVIQYCMLQDSLRSPSFPSS